MDFFDDAIVKAKDMLDVACKKTNEVVTEQKQKFDIASIEAKRAKDYKKLGELYFNEAKDCDIENAEIKALVEAIKEKNEKIKALKEEISAAKDKTVCTKCGAIIDKNSSFCAQCGEKL